MPAHRASRRKPRHLDPGFYSHLFKDGEILDLEAYFIDGLLDEIAMLRVWTRRVMAFAEGVESLDEAIGVLGALGVASLHLANLLRVQKLLGGASDHIEKELIRALDDIHREMNIQ